MSRNRFGTSGHLFDVSALTAKALCYLAGGGFEDPDMVRMHAVHPDQHRACRTVDEFLMHLIMGHTALQTGPI